MTQENLISSVRNRLKNISQKRKLDFQFVLTRYALERFLYRLSKSKYKNQFQFDGGILVDAISLQLKLFIYLWTSRTLTFRPGICFNLF